MLYDNEELFHVDGVHWEDVVSPFKPENVTPAGYDFTVDVIQEMMATIPEISRDDKRLPVYHDLEFERYNTDHTDMWYLAQGMYLVTFLEKVSIPKGYTGLMWPRSTLVRCGVGMHTAIWDAGYVGIGKSTLVVHGRGVRIQHGTRIGHMALFPVATNQGDKMYIGNYQGEGIR